MNKNENAFSNNLKFSLVVATKNRVAELEHFFDSLVNQTYDNLEVIIVDQNDDNRLEVIANKFANQLSVLHIKSETGISKARNKGLMEVSGDIVAFPDDDCLYPSDLLYKLNKEFIRCSDYDGITGILTEDVNILRKDKVITVNKNNVWKTVKSATVFLRREVVLRTGFFDENLGIGTHTGLGAGEETDYLIRVMDKGFTIIHMTAAKIIHPPIITNYNQWGKVFSYTKGSSYVLRKYKFPPYIFLYQIVRPVIGVFFFGLLFQKTRARYYYYSLKGKLTGYFYQLTNES